MTDERDEWPAGGEYEVVSLRIHWAGLSIAAFLTTLPFNYGRAWIWPSKTVLTVGALTAAGFLAGLIGLRHRRGRRIAQAGIGLNGTACVLLVLLELIYAWC